MATRALAPPDDHLDKRMANLVLRGSVLAFTSASPAHEEHEMVLIERTTLNGPETPIRNATLKNCTFNNVTVYNSSLDACVITGSFSILTGCSITGSVCNFAM